MRFSFSQSFCDWILNIFDSARISIILNRSCHSYFSVSRGVHQGDPLSLLLFCLVEDYLSRKLSILTSEGFFLLCMVAIILTILPILCTLMMFLSLVKQPVLILMCLLIFFGVWFAFGSIS